MHSTVTTFVQQAQTRRARTNFMEKAQALRPCCAGGWVPILSIVAITHNLSSTTVIFISAVQHKRTSVAAKYYEYS